MKTMFADFNAMTAAGHISLSTRGSQEDIQRSGARPGNWAWLSDGELIVGVQIAIDERHGLVGVPDWDTLVHLDDADLSYELVLARLNGLLSKELHAIEDEPEIFRLLTQLELVASVHAKNGSPGALAFRRALSLRQTDKLGLALLEMKEARRECPHNPDVTAVFLELLRREDLPSAVAEVEALTRSPVLPAVVLSACINILAAHAEQASDDQFDSIAEPLFDLCRRFDRAPDLDHAGESLVALSYFNRGMVHLRAARVSQARQAFETAERIYPVGAMADKIASLQTYDHQAREVARSVRAIAELWEPSSMVAA